MRAQDGGSVVVRRGAQRFTSTEPGITGRHCFSYGAHYDPDNVAFGPLLACNEFTLSSGAGFPPHPHAGLEILSWVLEGELTHTDSAGDLAGPPGTEHRIGPGQAQRLSAGTGVEHAERNGGPGRLRFVQLWLRPDRDGLPEYATADLRPALTGGALVTLAAGGPTADGAALTLRQQDATLSVAHLAAGAEFDFAPAGMRWIHLMGGELHAAGMDLAAGDELRATGAGALPARAGKAGAAVLAGSFDRR